MAIDVPGPVAHYLAADAAMDTMTLAQCFDQGAVVRDEGRDYHGLDAIQAWNRQAHRKYQYVVEPLRATTDGGRYPAACQVDGAVSRQSRGGRLSVHGSRGEDHLAENRLGGASA
jgi:hypothetical protein